jgi:CheY-like chemotaxis protein
MKDIIDWLRQVEQLACDVYQEASDHFSQDREFSSFLSRLVEDESLHFHLMGSAAQCLWETNEPPVSAIAIDSSVRDHVETPLKQLHKLMTTDSITRRNVVDCIVRVEFSEWNDIFLYVIETFQKYSKTFQYLAATIQAHQNRIERFLEDLSDDFGLSEEIRKIPRIWEERILIVEDEPVIRELFAKLLGRLGDIETASDGQEALNRVKDHFYNVVISDIDMPRMSGLEFYKKAVEMDPDIARHFIFVSGSATPEIENFFRKHNLACLEKPFRLEQLNQAVLAIVNKTL